MAFSVWFGPGDREQLTIVTQCEARWCNKPIGKDDDANPFVVYGVPPMHVFQFPGGPGPNKTFPMPAYVVCSAACRDALVADEITPLFGQSFGESVDVDVRSMPLATFLRHVLAEVEEPEEPYFGVCPICGSEGVAYDIHPRCDVYIACDEHRIA
jgi:hypothetical protein